MSETARPLRRLASRVAQSDRLTVVAWTLTRTSSVFGDGPLDLFESQDLRRPVPVVDNCFHESAFLLSFGCERRIGPPCFHIRPARNSSAGLPPVDPGRARRPVGMTQPLSATTLRRKFAPSRCTPQTPSYTALSSAMVKVGPTNAVAMPVMLEVDADTLDRIAHDPRVIERQLDLPVQRVGHRNQSGGCCVGARDGPTHVAKHREVGDRATFMRGSRPGSP